MRALAPAIGAEGSKRRRTRRRGRSHIFPASRRGPRGLVESGWRLSPSNSCRRHVESELTSLRARVGKVRRREEAESRTRTVNTWRKNRSDIPAISSLRSRDRRMHRVRASNELFFFFFSLSFSFSLTLSLSLGRFQKSERIDSPRRFASALSRPIRRD